MAMAVHRVVVDHAYRLHQGITNSRADKAKAALLEGATHGIRGWRGDRDHLLRGMLILLRLATRERPDIALKAAKFGLCGEKSAGVFYRRIEF